MQWHRNLVVTETVPACVMSLMFGSFNKWWWLFTNEKISFVNHHMCRVYYLSVNICVSECSCSIWARKYVTCWDTCAGPYYGYSNVCCKLNTKFDSCHLKLCLCCYTVQHFQSLHTVSAFCCLCNVANQPTEGLTRGGDLCEAQSTSPRLFNHSWAH